MRNPENPADLQYMNNQSDVDGDRLFAKTSNDSRKYYDKNTIVGNNSNHHGTKFDSNKQFDYQNNWAIAQSVVITGGSPSNYVKSLKNQHKIRDTNQGQTEGGNMNERYQHFVRTSHGQIYINDHYELQNRSKTAEAHRTGLPLQNVYMKMVPESQSPQSSRQQRNIYSRENIEQMKKKNRNLRTCQYSSKSLAPPESQFRLNHDTKILGLPKDILSTQRSFLKHTQVPQSQGASRKNSENLRSKSMKNIDKHFRCSALQAHNSLASSQENQSKSKRKSHQNISKQTCETFNKQTVEPNQFKARIKMKSIDDNPNVLANIIKRKVSSLERDELLDYLQKIMRKGTR